jgi:hypothetical protein
VHPIQVVSGIPGFDDVHISMRYSGEYLQDIIESNFTGTLQIFKPAASADLYFKSVMLAKAF